MTEHDPKADLHSYLQEGRKTLLWKLEGLSEYDIRRPLTPTATNLLGLVKHLTDVEAGYFGQTFDRPFPGPLPWGSDGPSDNEDMWATPGESREQITGLYRQACAHADTTIEALPIEAIGHVAWWGDREVTLHRMLVHVLAETHRHAGHADIVRELIDGTAGLLQGNENLPEHDEAWWRDYRDTVEQAARDSGQV